MQVLSEPRFKQVLQGNSRLHLSLFESQLKFPQGLLRFFSTEHLLPASTGIARKLRFRATSVSRSVTGQNFTGHGIVRLRVCHDCQVLQVKAIWLRFDARITISSTVGDMTVTLETVDNSDSELSVTCRYLDT